MAVVINDDSDCFDALQRK